MGYEQDSAGASLERLLFQLNRIRLCSLVCLVGVSIFQGCASGVGDPCLPEQIPISYLKTDTKDEPNKGYDRSEVYIEGNSVQCETRVCGVFQLDGDPSPDCNPTKSLTICSSQEDIDKRVYCTCRCKAPDKRFATCECPSGYECKEVLTKGDPGTRGSYCVKSGTLKTVNQ